MDGTCVKVGASVGAKTNVGLDVGEGVGQAPPVASVPLTTQTLAGPKGAPPVTVPPKDQLTSPGQDPLVTRRR